VARVGVVVLGVVIGLGVPAGWVWVGSQLQGGTTPSATALAVVHVGIIATLLGIAAIFSFLVNHSRERRRTKARIDWMRGMTEARRRETITDVHPLEVAIILAVLIDIVVLVVWFFFFADPGTPVGQG
jgi:hypothetical protein